MSEGTFGVDQALVSSIVATFQEAVENPFRALNARERNEARHSYGRFIAARDGELNYARRSLACREQFFEALAAHPLKWDLPFDSATFHRYMTVKAPSTLDPKVLWALATAKVNVSERYAVEVKVADRDFEHVKDDLRKHVLFEEFYHTKILGAAGQTLGLEYEMPDPKGISRALVELITNLPVTMHLPFSLCAELVGCVAFELLWEKADLFSERPEVVERLRLLMREILLDELGHVAFARARIGPVGLAFARMLYPQLVKSILTDLPEFSHLAGGPEVLRQRMMRRSGELGARIFGDQRAAA
jgi:hypothetical protein